ncbi:MAG: carbohydrate-binding protein, partial [Syntrophothermus sp.]
YNNWLKRLDIIVPYLQYLKEKKVEVLFRPLHEMNQKVFWWGGRPGPNGTAQLYRITHDYLTRTKGLDNLIWVWDMQDIDRTWAEYNPGDSYWDILGFDVYSDGYSQSWYNYAVSIAGDKPLAVGECGKLPTPAILSSQPRYVFFMAWAEMVFTSNTISDVRALYNAPNVLNRDQMPGWKDLCTFGSAPYSIPGVIEAENFNKCGEGTSYHDADAVNSKGQYRTDTGVDIESCTDGGYDVTDIQTGEWLGYSVSIDSAGSYMLQARVSSSLSGKSFHLELDGVNVSGPVNVPNTGGAQNWQTVSVQLPVLLPNAKTLRIVMDTEGFSINYIKLVLSNKSPSIGIISPAVSSVLIAPANIEIKVDAKDPDGSISKVEYFNGSTKLGENAASPFTFTWQNVAAGSYQLKAVATDNGGLTAADSLVIKVSLPQGPFGGRPHNIPGKVEAEYYDVGDEGVAYHDLTAGNKFNIFRQDNVDIESCLDTDGGYSIGDFQTGEWLGYTANVTQSGVYNIEFRVAAQVLNSMLSLEAEGKTLAAFVVPNTGGFQKWQTVLKRNIQLTAGQKVFKLVSLQEMANVNYMNFSVVTGVNENSSGIPEIFSLSQNYPNPFNPSTSITYSLPAGRKVRLKIFNILGNEVSTLVNEYKPAGIYSVQFDGSRLPSGFYIYKIDAGEFSDSKKLLLLK